MEEEQVDEVLVQLMPQEVREIDFYGDTLLIALVDGVPYVALHPIADFLGIDWTAQYRRLLRDDILHEKKISNYYQGVFTELYRRFGVPKYTLIHQTDYQNVLTFLNDWRKSAQGDE